MKLTIQGSAKEIAAFVLAVQERRDDEKVPSIDVDDLLCHSTKVDVSSLAPDELPFGKLHCIPNTTFRYMRPENIDSIVATTDRKEAIELIQNGAVIFTVPQMFNMEMGPIVLVVEDPNHKANRMSEEDAGHVLLDYEQSSRGLYNLKLVSESPL